MTLLSICQDVAEMYTEVPTVIYGSNNDTAKKLLSAARSAGKSLARRAENGWVEMQQEHTFTTVASQENYDLPSDYLYLLSDTLWDRANYWELRGPLTPQAWQCVKSSVLGDTDTNRKRFRIKNVNGVKKFTIHPVPDNNTDTLVFEYMSINWCQSSSGVGQSDWLNDTDTGILDEYLIFLETRWRFLRILGSDYDEEKAEADEEVNKAIARNGGQPVLQIGGRKGFTFLSSANIPDSGFG